MMLTDTELTGIIYAVIVAVVVLLCVLMTTVRAILLAKYADPRRKDPCTCGWHALSTGGPNDPQCPTHGHRPDREGEGGVAP